MSLGVKLMSMAKTSEMDDLADKLEDTKSWKGEEKDFNCCANFMVYAGYPKLFSGANKPNIAYRENRDLLSEMQVLVNGRFRRGTCLWRLILGPPSMVRVLVYGRL